MPGIATLAISLALSSAHATAHEGPPYPILVDELLAGVELSIWADSDVGEGTFFVYLDPPTAAIELELRSQPLDPPPGPSDATPWTPGAPLVGRAEPAPPRAPYQLLATLPFTHRGRWQTHFLITNGTRSGSLEHELEVTPPGLGVL